MAPPRLGVFGKIGAWLGVWTPPRGVEVPPVPWRRLTVGALLVVLSAGVLAALLVPRIESSKEEDQARERAQAKRALQRAVAAQGARFGGGSPGDERALLIDAEKAIAADARARGARAKRVDCAPARGGYDCLAVTSDIEPTETNKAGSVGVPFRAVLDVRRGRFAWCKVSPIPSERALPDPRSVAPLPRACRR